MTSDRWDRREFSMALAAALLPIRAIRAGALDEAPAATRTVEVEALRLFAEHTHPRGLEAAANTDWQNRWSTLKRDAATLDDGAYFIRTRRALSWFKDGHTTVLPFEYAGGVPAALAQGPFRLNLPYRAKIFSDGVWLVATAPAAKQVLGQRLLRVGDLSVIELMRAHATDWPGNDAWAQNWAASLFTSPALLHGLGALRNPATAIEVETIGSGGTNLQTAFMASPQDKSELAALSRTTSAHEVWAAAAGSGNYARHLPQHRALYISLDEMDDVKGKTFDALTTAIFKALATPRLQRVIVDIRRNGGGDNFLAEPLRKRLERSQFNRPGALYVLIGSATFSAAQNFATRMERETFAVFAGEPTGGAPNHFGDPAVTVGPASGITAIVSSLSWFDSYPQDVRPWIMPDLLVPTTFANWRSGQDPVLDAALAYQASAGEVAAAMARRSAYDRDSQRRVWKSFWRK